MNKQKITLVDVAFPQKQREDGHRIAREPIGILEMGPFLRQKAGVELVYVVIESPESPEVSAQEIVATSAGIVGFSTYTYNYNFILAIAREIKRLSPAIVIVLGGFHAGMIPDEVMRETAGFVDVVVSREGEGGMVAVLQGQRGVIRPNSISLADIPPADRVDDLFINSNVSLFSNQPKKLAVVTTSRGCYGTCNFCVDSRIGWWDKPIQNVLAEIKYLVNQRGIEVILFEDPLLNGNVQRLEQLCDELIRAKCTGEIGGFVALSMIGFNLGRQPAVVLEKMSQAGFIQLSWGIEDPRREHRISLNKKGNLQSEVLRMAQDCGIRNRALLMLPVNINCDDPEQDVLEYTQALIDLPLDEVKVNVMTPFPGTPLYESLFAKGKISDPNWDHYDTHQLVFKAGKWDQPIIDWARNYIVQEFKKSRGG